MDATETKLVIEAALLAAGRPLPFEKLVELFTQKGDAPDRGAIREGLDALAADYEGRGIELKEVANGFRIQIRSSMTDRLQPLWEERAPRYTRALLETLALIAYRQPITRSEIEEVRGVAVSSNIVRTLMERGWVRVVGHRDVPGKPAMLGTTREFLDYFGLKKLEDLPALTEFNEEHPELSPQADLNLVGLLDEDGGAAGAEGELQGGAALAQAAEATEAVDAEQGAELVASAGTGDDAVRLVEHARGDGGNDEPAGEPPAAAQDDAASDHVPGAEAPEPDAAQDRVAQAAQTPQDRAAPDEQAAPQEQAIPAEQTAPEDPAALEGGGPKGARGGAAESASEQAEASTGAEPDDAAAAPQPETPPRTRQSESGGL